MDASLTATTTDNTAMDKRWIIAISVALLSAEAAGGGRTPCPGNPIYGAALSASD